MTTQDTPTPEIAIDALSLIETCHADLSAMPPHPIAVIKRRLEAAIGMLDRQQRGEPSGYAYRYSSHDGGTVIRFNNGVEVNGSRPIESVPYWFAPQPADPVRVPRDEELIAWATLHSHRRPTMLTEKLAADIPQLRRGIVWCRHCGRSQRVDSAHALSNGWPRCCGYTMTIDSPDEQAALAQEQGESDGND